LDKAKRELTMRTPIAACLLMLLALPASAEIYSYTDASGNKVFTNQPPDGIKTESVKLPPMNTMDPPEVSTPADTTTSTSSTAQSQPYNQVQLTNLPTEEALRSNNGTFTVRAALKPALRPGDSLQLLLDGQPYGTPTNVPLLQLSEIDRGDHTLVLQVKSGDQVVQESAPVSFTVQRVAVGGAKPAQPLPKPRN
jgi:hypothetical protein